MFEGNFVTLRAYRREDLPLAISFLNDIQTQTYLGVPVLFPFRCPRSSGG
jgi:hypothetical protein